MTAKVLLGKFFVLTPRNTTLYINSYICFYTDLIIRWIKGSWSVLIGGLLDKCERHETVIKGRKQPADKELLTVCGSK